MVTLTHTAAGGNYAGVTAELAVTVTDDDRGIILTPGSLSVDEGDTAGVSYTVKLATQPSEQVTVTVTGQSGTDLTLDKTTLTFTTTTWGTAQTVIVKAVQDTDGADDAVTLTHTAGGGNYAGVTADLAVTIKDDGMDSQPTPSCDDLESYEEEDVGVTNQGKQLADQDKNADGNVPLLTTQNSLEGYIAPCDDWDMFRFELEEGKYYRIDFLGSATRDGTLGAPNILGFFTEGLKSSWFSTSVEPVWYRHSDGKRPFSVYAEGGATPMETIWVTPDTERQANWSPLTEGNRRGGVGDNARQYLMRFPAGTYYVLLGSSGYSSGTYRISLTEVSDDDSGIRSTSVGSSITGSLDFVGDEDTFEVDLTAGQTYTISIVPQGPSWESSTVPFVSKVENVASSTVTNYPFTTKYEMRSFTFTPDTTGAYRFTIKGHKAYSNPHFADGEYQLTIATT